MSRIRREDVEHVARLARLALSEDEKNLFLEQLNDILDATAKLQELPTHDVPPTPHAVPLQNVWRSDERRPSLAKEKALQNAPHEEDGYFWVPRILE